MLGATAVTGVASVANTVVAQQDLGLTWAALILALGGSVGGWIRAALSDTQNTGGPLPWQWNKRTWIDVLVGAGFGVIFPVVGQKVATWLGITGLDFTTWTVLQQAMVAMLIGGGSSWVWTVIGWRRGYIVPSADESEPRVGVLKPKQDQTGGSDAPQS